MAESYSVKARLSATDSGFTSTLKSAIGATETLASKIKSGFAFGILTGAGQKAFGMLTSGVSGLISEMNSSNAAWKTFEGNMAIIESSGGKLEKSVADVKKELQDFAGKTVYGASDMAATYAQLAAVGTKDTSKLVKAFGGLAAASENPQQAMKTLSQQATQMAAKPSVAWADFKLMLEQTPAGIAAVAKEMGMSTSEMVTAVQDGKVSTDAFFAAIVRAGGEGTQFEKMATQAKTVGQAIDGAKESLSNKLMPAFDVLSKVGIDAVDSIAGAFDKIDAQALADKISSAVKTIKTWIDTAKKSFEGVGSAFGDAFSAIKSALGKVNGGFSQTGALDTFKSVCESVAGALKRFAGFLERNADTIAKVLPWVTKLAAAFALYKVVNTVAPWLTSFAGSLLKMAGKGIAGLAAKLLGISVGQKAVGTASQSSAPSVMQSAVASLALGAAVMLAAVGLALLVQSAIALANNGWGAVGALVGLVAVIALLAVGAAALGPALTAGAVGFIAFGAAIALIGLGAALAGVGLMLVASVLPQIITYGAQGAVALAQLGLGLAAFAIGAALAGVACLALGVSLTVVAVAVSIVAAAFLVLATAMLIAAVSLVIVSAALPALIAYGSEAASAIVTLGAALVVFGACAVVAGAAVIVLGAAFLVASVGILLCAAGIAILAVSIIAIGTFAAIAGASFALMAAVLPLVTANSVKNAAALAILSAGLAVLGAGALVAGAGFVVLGAGLLVAAAGILTVGVAITVLAAGILVLSVSAVAASGAIMLLSMALPFLTENAAQNLVALVQLGAGLLALGAGALTASVGVAAFGVAMIAAAAGTLVLAAALLGVSSQMHTIASDAKAAEKSLKTMNNAMSAVKSGLEAIGSKAKSSMKKLLNAFDDTTDEVKRAGKEVGTGFTKGMQEGLAQAPAVALMAVSTVAVALNAGRARAFSAGAYISQGFAQGMLSCLGVIQNAAARMAAAADKAVRAKAKIHSPSKIAENLGHYWGDGYAGGLSDMARKVWDAAERLVSVPQVATPDLAMAYGGELSSDYSYSRYSDYTIEVPLTVDGKEFARATASYTQDELDRKNIRESRKHGKV